MNTIITPEIREVMEAVHYRPAVSIIIPFEQKMNLKNELTHSLKIASDKVERELLDNYKEELCSLVMHRLRAIIKDLKIDTHKKCIAIFVSPVFEKVMYLDIAVEERIIVDESFEIRDLVYSKKELHKYLVILLSEKESRMYLGNSDTLIRLVTNKPESVDEYINEVPERVANFSDISDRKETILKKFLHNIDISLESILKSYPLPLFVFGTRKTTGYFKNLTKNNEAVIEYVHGNFEEATHEQLKDIIKPHVADWKKLKQIRLLRQLEAAAGDKKLAVGMKDVWHEAMNQKGRLLVVEKDYMYAAEHGSTQDVISEASEPFRKISYIKDAVDDVIEKILESGGDVEFVDKNLLTNYNHIALIKYY